MIENRFTIQESFAISAGAGSGKTYTLSRRYINAVLGFDFIAGDKEEDRAYPTYIEYKDKNKADLSQIVTITYTEAAALEMKERIFGLMEKIVGFDTLDQKDKDYDSIKIALEKIDKTQQEYVKKRLQEALQSSNEAFISTIHSFCLDTIGKNSDLAKLDSSIDVIQEDEKYNILNEARLEVLTEDEERTLDLFSKLDSYKTEQIIEKYATNSKFRTSFDAFVEEPIEQKSVKAMIQELYPLPELSDEASKELDEKRYKWFEEYRENFENFRAKPWGKLKKDQKAPTLGKKYPNFVPIKEAYEDLVGVYAMVDDELERVFMENLKKLHTLLQKIYEKYTKKLYSDNKIDFDTIITKTAKIITQTKTNYKYIMVDEFQDTNSLQNEIVSHIAKDANLFVVGDSKQSIYSFQGAELEVFNEAVNKHQKAYMSLNFRSDKKILSFVNELFRELFEQQEEKRLIQTNYKAEFNKEDELQPSKNEEGSVEFLISQEDGYQIVDNQLETIAKFVKAIVDDKIEGYSEVKEAIQKKQKAIGILFDSSSKMLQLKKELNRLGVECKVSATENFYHTREVEDLFLVLKATQIVATIANAPEPSLSKKAKFFIAGALRSGVFRYDEKQIYSFLNGDPKELVPLFSDFMEAQKRLSVSMLIKYIVDSSKLLDIYLYLGDIAQRAANIEKLIDNAIRFEKGEQNTLYHYLKELERNIYFNDEIKEDEAFYESENVESVELCTIHSTKGLAYPMVILAQSEKGLHANASTEMGLSFTSFTLSLDGKSKEFSGVGFKVGEYEPLIYRALKQISKNKHEAEKKRLLYVALTRPQHNLVIAGSIYRKSPPKPTKKEPNPVGEIGLSENSYLGWMAKALQVDKETLFENRSNEKIVFIDKELLKDITGKKIDPNDYELAHYKEQKVTFKEDTKTIASNNKQKSYISEELAQQAKIGTAIHAILEHYWDRLEDDSILPRIFLKHNIFKEDEKKKIKHYIENFKTTPTYKKLKDGAEHHFEWEFDLFEDDKHTQGNIDLLYYDTQQEGWVIVDFKSNNTEGVKDLHKFAVENGYDKQLETYEKLCDGKGLVVKQKLLLFLDSGNEIKL